MEHKPLRTKGPCRTADGAGSDRVAKQAIASQLAAVMREQRISKVEMAKRLGTSRSQLDRLLDPTYDGVTLAMLCRAARAVGREVKIELQ